MIKVILALSAVSLFHLSLSVGRYLSHSIQVGEAQEARTIQDREEQQRAIESIARKMEAQRKAEAEAFERMRASAKELHDSIPPAPVVPPHWTTDEAKLEAFNAKLKAVEEKSAFEAKMRGEGNR